MNLTTIIKKYASPKKCYHLYNNPEYCHIVVQPYSIKHHKKVDSSFPKIMRSASIALALITMLFSYCLFAAGACLPQNSFIGYIASLFGLISGFAFVFSSTRLFDKWIHQVKSADSIADKEEFSYWACACLLLAFAALSIAIPSLSIGIVGIIICCTVFVFSIILAFIPLNQIRIIEPIHTEK